MKLENANFINEVENNEVENTNQYEGFVIDSLEKATKTFKKLRKISSQIAEIEEVAAAEKALIEDWETKETKRLKEEKEYLEGLINMYYAAEKEKDKKFKLSTPYGTCSSRTTKKWIYDDEKLIQYCKNAKLPYIKVSESIDKTAIKKDFKEGINPATGEALEGVTIEEVTTYTVKTK